MSRGKVSAMAAMAGGRRRVDAGDIPGAIRRFDRAVRIDANCAQAYLYRAGLKLLARDLDGAAADFRALSALDHSFLPAYRDLTTLSAEEFPALLKAAEAVVRREPDCAWAWVFRAFTQRSLMRYDEAVADLNRATALEPKSAAMWALSSRVKLTNRQAEYDGVRDMETAAALAPDWGWIQCWLGEALRHRGELKRALAALDRGLELEPRYLRGWAWRGGVKVALGDYRGARRDLDRSLAWDPIYSYDFEYTYDQKSWAYNQRQIAGRGLGEIRSALRDLNQAHRFGPRYAWVYSAARDPRDYERGVSELDAYLKRSPSDGWGWAWRGWTLHQAGRDDEALESLSRASSLAPSAAWPRAWKGRALAALGRDSEAVAPLSAALKRDPGYAPGWGWRAESRRRLGDLRGAVADFTAAVRLDHRAAWALAGRGEAKRGLGDLAGSLSDLDRALGILPDYPEALGWRAETRRLLGDLKGALRDADLALKSKPGLVLVYVTRALVKRARKDFRGQLQDMRRAVKLDPGLFAEAGR
jgi:tetratricopeptide (TPR) repeat protein